MLNNLLQIQLKLLHKEWFKNAEATGDLIGNKLANKITRISETSPKNNSETNEEETLRERFVPPELGYKIIDDLRLKEYDLR